MGYIQLAQNKLQYRDLVSFHVPKKSRNRSSSWAKWVSNRDGWKMYLTWERSDTYTKFLPETQKKKNPLGRPWLWWKHGIKLISNKCGVRTWPVPTQRAFLSAAMHLRVPQKKNKVSCPLLLSSKRPCAIQIVHISWAQTSLGGKENNLRQRNIVDVGLVGCNAMRT
jgi:hypothetical protein